MEKTSTTSVLLGITLTAFILLMGCSKGSKGDKIIDIEKEFNINLWEQLDEDGGNLQLLTATIQNQKCSGTRIEYNQNNFNNKITVTLKSLIAPLSCDGKLVPALDTISIGNLNKGTYKFNINLKDAVINDGTLFVEEGRYVLNMTKEDGINVKTKEVLRVPRGAIWGFVAYNAGQETILNKFNDNLLRIATPLSIPQGEYGYFTVKPATIEVKSTFDTKKTTTRQILYNLTGNRLDLQALVKDYRSQGLDIKILTYDGKVF